jgi:hypothetical protein
VKEPFVTDQPQGETPEPIGWFITDPDGNVVDSGPVTVAKPTVWVGELLAEAARNEGEQE